MDPASAALTHPSDAGSSGYIALCSRGLVHSRTMEAVTDILQAYRWNIRYTHDLPIPDAQNAVVCKILEAPRKAEWILFIEEDNVPPPDFLEHATTDSVQTVGYNLTGGNWSIRKDDSGRVVYTGMGCLLMAADIFRNLPKPWFSVRSFVLDVNGSKEILKPMSECRHYGGQDVALSYALQQSGIPIHQHTELRAQHLKVKCLGNPGTNNGCHEIEAL